MLKANEFFCSTIDKVTRLGEFLHVGRLLTNYGQEKVGLLFSAVKAMY
jgi:hypothetical protein